MVSMNVAQDSRACRVDETVSDVEADIVAWSQRCVRANSDP